MGKKGAWTIAAVCSVTILLGPSCVRRSISVPQEARTGMSLCEVLDNWQSHHLQPTRIQGIFATAFEASVLYDPNCRDRSIWVDFPSTVEAPVKGDTKRFKRLLGSRHQVSVVFEGIFHGPALYKDIDSRTPVAIRKIMEKSPIRFGHMGSYEFMLDLKRIVSVNPVHDETKNY